MDKFENMELWKLSRKVSLCSILTLPRVQNPWEGCQGLKVYNFVIK